MHSALCISWQQPGEKQCGNHAQSCLELQPSIFIYDDMPICHTAFSVRQERSGSLLIVYQVEGRESSCLLFSMLPLDQFLSQINALVAVGLKQGTEEHGAVPVFSSKIWLQSTGNSCYKF